MEKEATYLRIAIAEHMSGVIIATADEGTKLDTILATGRPIVAVDRSTTYDIDGVVMANRAAGTSATKDLIDAGYRRIAYIGGPEHIDTAAERAAGWRTALGAAYPELDLDALQRFETFRVDGGRAAMEDLLSLPEPPDAVVAGNNLIGVGAIQVLTEHGLTPPQVGVAVIGSLPFTTLSPSAVTVVRLPARHMGVTAARMLLERIKGDKQPKADRRAAQRGAASEPAGLSGLRSGRTPEAGRQIRDLLVEVFEAPVDRSESRVDLRIHRVEAGVEFRVHGLEAGVEHSLKSFEAGFDLSAE